MFLMWPPRYSELFSLSVDHTLSPERMPVKPGSRVLLGYLIKKKTNPDQYWLQPRNSHKNSIIQRGGLDRQRPLTWKIIRCIGFHRNKQMDPYPRKN